MPFAARSLQVNGAFEAACAQRGLSFKVPQPQPDGCVEKANDSSRVEFQSRQGGD